jgi:exoribonuclease-2
VDPRFEEPSSWAKIARGATRDRSDRRTREGTMNILFEDEGQLRAGTILADNDASLMVESVSGKRMKVKAASVLLRFATPTAAETISAGQRLMAELDADFLWEASDEGDFGFADLAREYYGGTPAPSQAAAVALKLHASPMHFYKRGKGRYRKAPPDALKAALASVERKAKEAEQIASWRDELVANRLPDALRDKLDMLLYRPDKNALEWKALAAACDVRRTNPLDLLSACGAIASTHEYHYKRFLVEALPHGTEFPPHANLAPLAELPVAAARAFSIDDATTTEIDDAFSVRELANGNFEIGIHIAAPALAIAPGSDVDRIARARLSTVYMPGRKITMLPDEVIAAFTLREGTTPPALSLYIEATPDGAPVGHRTAIERVEIAANLRLDAIGDEFARELPWPDDPRWTAELRVLWKLAQHLATVRDRSEIERVEFNFHVDWDAKVDGEPGRITLVPRARGSPLDRLVAELMIHVNSTWGRALADAGIAGLYRQQSGGKVRMSTKPGEHQGLGVEHYLWASSPLRRYSDLVNQRQIAALTRGDAPPYGPNDAELAAALADFEATYAQYLEFQSRMEHYWCLRWLVQERVSHAEATVVRDNLVRLDAAPLYLRLPDLPSLSPGTPVRVAVVRIDLLGDTIEAKYASSPSQKAEMTEVSAARS